MTTPPEEHKEKIRFDPEEYELRKRLPPYLSRRKNDVYVNMKTDFKGQLERCKKLINSGQREVFIHGLGAAVNRAVNLALQIQSHFQGLIDADVRTSSVELVDDFEPQMDDLEPRTQTRQNSAVHIRLFNASQQEETE